MTRDEIFAKVRATLVDNFEVPEERVTDDARLMEDLELDSIDAIDMAVQLQEMTACGRKKRLKKLSTLGTVRCRGAGGAPRVGATCVGKCSPSGTGQWWRIRSRFLTHALRRARRGSAGTGSCPGLRASQAPGIRAGVLRLRSSCSCCSRGACR